MTMNKHAANRGVALLVVLGILVILALLATVFATVQSAERATSRNYVDAVRARLVAQSGVEDAVSRIEGILPQTFSPAPGARAWVYYGDDLAEKSPQPAVPVERAKNPSFAFEDEAVQNPADANTKPKLLKIEGLLRGFSGAAETGRYAAHGDQYALRVADLSGCIHVNDGVEGGPNGSVSQNLRRILNVLGEELQIAKLGDRILDHRPPSGYASRAQLMQAVEGNADEYRKFAPFVTAHAWVDRNVANPVPLSAAAAKQYPVKYQRGDPPLYRFGKQKDAFGAVYTLNYNWIPDVPVEDPSAKVYGLDTLNPQYVEIVGRAPVNVNAAPREVLVALLTGLRGFFVSDRRRNNPNWNGDLYLSFRQKTTLSPVGTEGDEIGFLYATLPIVGPGMQTTQGISAFTIADEILACREKRASANFDYSNAWFGGPFRNWRQFNTFCDHLVAIGVIQDNRPIFFDYGTGGMEPTGWAPLVSSPVQQKLAAQAIADVLKANFNPNLHLNELNPDANLATVVDKTDLIVNSTEFTFLPTGYFEIESVGRVLRPVDGAADALAAADNQIVAQSKTVCVVKLFDLLRETNQKQFYAGEFSARGGPFPTNNNRSVECGPEPDNGPAPRENEWDGHVALATAGGNFTNAAAQKPKDALWKTIDRFPNGASGHCGSSVCVHFTYDFDAHHHKIAQARQELGSTVQPTDAVVNFPDPGETACGPYEPTDGPPGRHRLCRSFRVTPGQSLALAPIAPSDLRIDGGYVERHASPTYAASRDGEYLFDYSAGRPSGTVSFWIKPGFRPELTGKVRALWDHSRYHEPCYQDVYVSPFALWFFPSHYTSSIAEAGQPAYFANNMGKFHPASFVFGSKAWHEDVPGKLTQAWFGNISRSLNHAGHADEGVKRSPLRANRWLHVAFSWRVDQANTGSKMFVNGTTWDVPYTFTTMTGWVNSGSRNYWDHDGAGERNHLRLGNPSKIAEAAGTPHRGNHTTDATYDEFLVWDREADQEAMLQWTMGRYHKPIFGSNEGVFTSQWIEVPLSENRSMPPCSTAVPPEKTGGGGKTGTLAPAAEQRRILGIAWTWIGEDLDGKGKPVVYDYAGSDPSALSPTVDMSVETASEKLGPFTDDAFAPVGVVVQGGEKIRYKARFLLPGANLSTILLATPVLDDVTIYVSTGAPKFVSFWCENLTAAWIPNGMTKGE